jgi:hypothetical protein
MLIKIKSKRLLRLAGWKRKSPSYVRAGHGLWWQWLVRGDGQILSSDVVILVITAFLLGMLV